MAQERLAPGGRLRYSRSSETDKKHLTAVRDGREIGYVQLRGVLLCHRRGRFL